MAATFTVEDGTNVSGANAYCTIATVDTYNDDHEANSDWSGATDAVKQKGIRLATAWLDNRYRGRWRGERYNDDQSLAWPRTDIEDSDGYTIDAETIPTRLADACSYLAIRQVAGDTLFPVVEHPGLKSHSYANASESDSKTYTSASLGTGEKRYPTVDALLAELVHSGPEVMRA